MDFAMSFKDLVDFASQAAAIFNDYPNSRFGVFGLSDERLVHKPTHRLAYFVTQCSRQ
jgi:hypothetical protein